MKWVKSAVVDLVAFILIVASSFIDNEVLSIAIWIYTGILLVGKVLFFFSDFLKSKSQKTNVPDWFYHTIYCLSFVVLFITNHYYLSAAWALIWILSIIPSLKNPKKKTSKS